MFFVVTPAPVRTLECKFIKRTSF